MSDATHASTSGRWLRDRARNRPRLEWLQLLVPVPAFAIVVAVIVMFYPMLRGAGWIPVDTVYNMALSISEERAASLKFRLDNEDALLTHANQKPLAGWGSWGRSGWRGRYGWGGRWRWSWSRSCRCLRGRCRCRSCWIQLGQFVDVSFQLCCAGGCVLGLTLLSDLGFRGGLPGFGFLGQGEAVRRGHCRAGVLHFGADAAGGLAIGLTHLCLGHGTRQTPAEFIEVAALGRNDLASFARAHSRSLAGARKVQHHAGPQAVDVVPDEGLGVGPQHRHQHLVQRDTGGAVGFGDATGGVACRHGDLRWRGRRRLHGWQDGS